MMTRMNTASTTVAAIAASLAVAVVGLMFVSGRTAENGCTDAADRRGFTSISDYSWSWSPLGTTCRFDDRVTETRLFW